MAKYISNRLKNLTIGLDSYSENLTSLNIIGDVKVGAGVTISSSAGIVTAVGFKKVGGTNSQFMMADGSVNSSTFLTAESDTLDTILNRGNTTTKSLSVGVATASRLEISSTFPRILLTDTNNNDDFSIDNADGTFRVRDRTNAANRFEIASNGRATLYNDVGIEGGLEVDGNISVGGTITYNDVTNVDSIGIITARKDIHVGAGLSVVGVSTFTGLIDANGNLDVDGTSLFRDNITISNAAPKIFLTDSNNNPDFEVGNFNGGFRIRDTTSNDNRLTIDENGHASIGGNLDVGGAITVTANINTSNSLIVAGSIDVDGHIVGDNSTNISGIASVTATSFHGSGANLTDVMTTSGGSVGDLSVSGIASVGIGTTGDTFTGKVDLFHEGDIKLRTTPAGVQVVGILSATSLDFTGAEGAFSDDLLLQGGSANALWDRSESYLQFNDGAKAVFGTDVSDGDLEIFHSGSHSYISENGTGDLFIITGAVGLGSTAIKISDGSSTLYYQGAERLKTTSTGITLTGTLTADIEGNATTADKATDLAINATQQLVLQTGNNATDVLASGTAGYVLQSNGSGSAPTWAATAPANAITGITIREDGGLVGTANSVSTINFTGAGVGVTFTNPVAGIATVTIGGGGGDSSAVMLSMIFG